MNLQIPITPTAPYDFDLSFSFLGPACPDPIARFENGVFSRIWPLHDGRDVLIRLRSVGTVDQPELILETDGEALSPTEQAELTKQITTRLCLDLDLEPFYTAIRRDSLLYDYCLRNRGLKPVLKPTLFEALSWAIIGQQVNLRFACQVKEGMLQAYARKTPTERGIYYHYPRPRELAGLDPAEWVAFKSSRRKAEYVIGLADKITSGWNLDALLASSDDQIIEELTKIRGIGQWTAEYVLIQGFRRFDALPVGDAGLQNGFRKIFGMERKPTTDEMVERAEGWRPYRGLATYYLWWGNKT